MHYTLAEIRDAGCTAGAAICPATPADSLAEVAAESLDLALCMSVNPGWGAQQLIPASIGKLQRMRAALPAHVALEVDGGVHQDTAAAVVAGRRESARDGLGGVRLRRSGGRIRRDRRGRGHRLTRPTSRRRFL